MKYKWIKDGADKKPVYVMLADFIRDAITDGRFKKGAKLPGRKQLMEMFGVSRNTVVSAFGLLQDEGLISVRSRSGTVVCDNASNTSGGVAWDVYIRRGRHKPGSEGYKRYSGGLTDFSLSSDFNIAPYLENAVLSALERMRKGFPEAEFTKYGLSSLRDAVKNHAGKFGIKTDVGNILITSENIQRLYYIYEALTTQGSIFLCEKANIINTISNIHSIGLNKVPVKADKHGLLISDLERKLPKYPNAVLHLDPTDNAPTGTVMSRSRRLKFIDIIKKYRLPVIEVDHSANIWHDRTGLNPIKSMDTCGNIIYIGSFLKFYPFDMQISWIIADKYIIEHLSNVFAQASYKANAFGQLVAEELFRSGAWYVMAENIRKFVCSRRQMALELCDRHLKTFCIWNEKNCWYHFWLDFPGMNMRGICERFINVQFYPGYFFDRDDKSHLLLCPASVTEKDLKEAVLNIGRIAGRRSFS